ncbi:MAG: N-6 DNA methylase [Bacteroidetes bacterium]|nr:N-6 DNA methylase [Bacteroidota bacterium]
MNYRYENSLKTFGYKIDFDFKMVFSEVFHNKGGFDVVIANPPWGIKVNEEQQVKLSFKVNKNLDSSEYFILRSEQLMYPSSVLTFIVPKSMIFANNWKTSRKYLLDRIIIAVADAGITFENVNLESFVFVVKNTKNAAILNKVRTNKFEPVKKYASIKILHRLPIINQDVMYKADSIILADLCPISKSIVNKIQKSDQFLDSIPREVFRGLYIPDSVKEKILDKGKGLYVNKVPDVGLYTIKRVRNIDLSKINKTKEKILKKLNCNRIIVKVLRGKKLTCTFAERGILTTEKLVNLVLKDANYSYFYILGLLNSSLISFYFAKAVFSDITETSRVMDDCYLSKAPIKKLNSKEQKPFKSIVEKILAMTDDEDYLQNPQKQARVKTFQAEIDQLVYQLYDLTPEEIKIVEGEKSK